MNKRSVLVNGILLTQIAIFGAPPPKETPTTDLPGATDHPLIGRFAGSVIVSREVLSYDEAALPLEALKEAEPRRRDTHNNSVYAPDRAKQVEGKRTRLIYAMPEEVSALQVFRNYQTELAKKGGKTLFECKGDECGASQGGVMGGGGSQSLAMFLWDQDRVKDKPSTAGYCAQNGSFSDSRYAAVELPKQNAHASILIYQFTNSYCKYLDGRTIAVVDIIEGTAIEQKMVTVKAEEMAQSIKTDGRVALYGIYFDTGKQQVKPESKPTLEQIARLLESNRQLKLLVVGHTDNAGEFERNMDLSRRRAGAVVAALVSQHRADGKRLLAVGVSSASPVAANASEEGKAKNRRVELVSLN